MAEQTYKRLVAVQCKHSCRSRTLDTARLSFCVSELVVAKHFRWSGGVSIGPLIIEFCYYRITVIQSFLVVGRPDELNEFL